MKPAKKSAKKAAKLIISKPAPRGDVPKLTVEEFKEFLQARRIVANAVQKLAPMHRDPEGFCGAWSHICLWIEDNA